MNTNLLLLIFGMMLVTYLPRVIPFLTLSNKPLPTFWQNVLQNIPFAILGALIFPGVLHIHEHLWYGLLGAVSAIFLSYIGVNIIIVILGAVFVLVFASIMM